MNFLPIILIGTCLVGPAFAGEKTPPSTEMKAQIIELLESGALDAVLEKRIVAVSRNLAQRRAERTRAVAQYIPVGNYELEHLRGDPKAKFSIIEYSMYGCPYCAKFHKTAKQALAAMDNINWVYRHLTLRGPEAASTQLAYASECIAKLGGNDAFWLFSDGIYGGSMSLRDHAKYVENFARTQGLDHQALIACQKEVSTIDKVKQSTAIARKAKFSTTPSIIVRNNESGAMRIITSAVDLDGLKKKLREIK
jgi:protein-disulfide isomerase